MGWLWMAKMGFGQTQALAPMKENSLGILLAEHHFFDCKPIRPARSGG
jgi:hypothetical protein